MHSKHTTKPPAKSLPKSPPRTRTQTPPGPRACGTLANNPHKQHSFHLSRTPSSLPPASLSLPSASLTTPSRNVPRSHTRSHSKQIYRTRSHSKQIYRTRSHSQTPDLSPQNVQRIPPQHPLPAAPSPAAPPLLRPLATSCLELSVPPRSSRNSHSSRKHMLSQPPRAPQPRNSAAVSPLSLSFAHSAHALSCNLTRASQLTCLMSCTESSAAENLTITQLLSNSYLDR